MRNAGRVRHRDVLVPLLADLLRTRSKQQWLTALEAAQVPCSAINDLAEVLADPQVLAREMAVAVPHPLNDTLRLVASPMKLSDTPVQVLRAPALLGQHTQEVLAELGLDDAEHAWLRALGVV
jgi:crotonobetainyl-CoA:carnitine CoA-transferase CaiB-like acyl-CoA transferase